MFLSYQKDENSNNIKTEQIRKIKDEVIKETEKQNDLNYMLAKALPTTSTSTQHCIDEDTQSLFNQPPSINSFPNYIHSLPFSINRNLLQSLFFLFHRNPALLSSYSNLLQNQFNYFYTHYNNFPHFYDHLRSCLSIKPDNENHKIIDNEDKGLKLCDSRSKLGSDLLFSGDYHEEKKRKVGDIIRNKKKNNSENFKIDRILNNCFDQKQKSPAQKIFSKEDKLLLSKSPKDIPTQRNRNLFFPIGELQESIYDNGFARNTLKEHQHNYFESFLNNFATKDFPSSTNTNQYNKSYKNKFKNKAENDRKNFPLFYYEDRVPKPLVKLEGVELWRKFHEACTEMVITKNGRLYYWPL